MRFRYGRGWAAAVMVMLAVSGSIPLPTGSDGAPGGAGRTGEEIPLGPEPYTPAVASAPAPDLTVESVAPSPDGPMDGQGVVLLVTVRNAGVDLTVPFDVALYADGNRLGSETVNGLGKDAATVAAFRWTASSGPHQFRAVVDEGAKVSESREGNNALAAVLAVPYPDLIVESLGTVQAGVNDGDQTTVQVVIRNGGAGGTLRRISALLSVDGTTLATRSLNGLLANGTLVIAAPWRVTGGWHDVSAVIDPEGAVAESNESNNRALTVVAPGLPDIAVDSLALSPSAPRDGEAVNLTAAVRNGGANTTATVRVDFFLDGDFHETATLQGLATGESRNATVRWVASGGTHALAARASGGGADGNSTNNAADAVVTVPKAQLAVPGVAVVPGRPMEGETVNVSVTVRNAGAGRTLRPFAVELYADSALAGTMEIAGLAAGEQRTVVFRWNASGGDRELRAVVDPDNRVPESGEGDNYARTTLGIPPAALSATAIFWSPAILTDGAPAALNATVRNSGSSTLKEFEVAFAVDGVRVGTALVRGLAANRSAAVSVPWIPLGGSHQLRAEVDPSGAVFERYLRDNILLSSVYVHAADIELNDIRWSPTSPAPGTLANITVSVRNAGATTSRPLPVETYMDGTLLSSLTLPGLASASSADIVVPWRVAAGNHTVYAVADRPNSVRETNETNNNLQRAFPSGNYTRPSGGRDLWISDLKVLPAAPADGQATTLVATVAGGSGGDPVDLGVSFYMDGLLLGRESLRLASTTGTVLRAWTATGGAGTLRAVVDAEGLVQETNETNNGLAINISVPACDLTVTGVSTGVEPRDGEEVLLFANLSNTGPGSRAGPFQVDFYIDGAKAVSRVVDILPAGNTTSVTASWKASPGAHTVRAVADGRRAVEETDEGNNWAETAVAVAAPDLSIGDVRFTREREDSATVTVLATVVNGGGATVRHLSVSLIADGILAGTTVMAGFPANGSISTTFSWKASPGSHMFTLVADSAGAVAESDEGNNIVTAAGPLVALPDLAAESVTAPPSAGDGERVLLSGTVANRGGGTEATFLVVFTIDGNHIGTTRVDGLGAGQSTTVSVLWETVPGASGGNHALAMLVDTAGAVEEADEANNQFNGSGPSVVPGDIAVDDIYVPDTAVDGESVVLYVVVANAGPTAILRPLDVALYADGVYVGSQRVTGLFPGGGLETFGSRAVVPFRWLAAASVRPHLFFAAADSGGAVAEAGEANNFRWREALLVDAADLRPVSVESVRTVENARAGKGAFTLFATVENAGPADTLRSFEVAYYTPSGFAGSRSVAGLPSGKSATVSIVLTESSTLTAVKVVADPAGAVVETDETDNVLSDAIAISAEPPGAVVDLSVEGVTVYPPAPEAGQEVHLFASIGSNGNGSTSRLFTVEFQSDGTPFAHATVAGFRLGRPTVVGAVWKAAESGHRLTVVVDPANTVGEFYGTQVAAIPSRVVKDGVVVEENRGHFVNATTASGKERDAWRTVAVRYGLPVSGKASITRKSDNLWAIQDGPGQYLVKDNGTRINIYNRTRASSFLTLNVGVPELRVSTVALRHPDAPLADGRREAVAVVVDNDGAGLHRPFALDLTFRGAAQGRFTLGGLPSKNSTTVLVQFTPSSGERGSYIMARADPAASVAEGNRLDDTLLLEPATSFPDLAVEDISWSPSIGNESRVRLFAAVVNRGGGPTERASTVEFSADGAVLASVPLPPLPAGARAVVSVAYTRTPGAHAVSAGADPLNAVHESSESNNARTEDFPVGVDITRPAPALDLFVSNFTYRQTNNGTYVNGTRFRLQNTLTFVVNVSNFGEAPAGRFAVALFGDGDLLETRSVPGLPAGGSAVLEYDWVATTESHVLKVFIDSEFAVPEDDETDNDANLTTPKNSPPRADAGGNKAGKGAVEAGDRVRFIGTGNDTDGFLALYEWDFNGDGKSDWTSNSSGLASYAYNRSGVYRATLRVTDNYGATAFDTITVQVNAKPVPVPITSDWRFYAAISLLSALFLLAFIWALARRRAAVKELATRERELAERSVRKE